MDWFKVTHAWAEKCDRSGFCRYKFRFEKFDFSEDGWWATEASHEKSYAIREETCSACQKVSPLIYKEGWMCLEKACANWWKVNTQHS
jgi:hypothetical protein